MAFIPAFLNITTLLSYDNMIFDIDGVLLHGRHTALPKAPEFMNMMVTLGKHVYIVTNNDAYTMADRTRDLRKVGFHSIEESNIVSPLRVGSAYFVKNGIKNQKFYGVCNDEIKKQLTERFNITFADMGESQGVPLSNPENILAANQEKVSAVLVGSIPDINNFKLNRAINYLKDPNVAYYAINPDMKWEKGDITLVDIGYFLLQVKLVVHRDPMMFGKPAQMIIDYFKPILRGGRTIMFGDTLKTDILFANANGWDSAMTLTGVNKAADIVTLNIQPTYLIDFVKIVEEAAGEIY